MNLQQAPGSQVTAHGHRASGMCPALHSSLTALDPRVRAPVTGSLQRDRAHMIMVALVAAATSGSTPISSISGPYSGRQDAVLVSSREVGLRSWCWPGLRSVVHTAAWWSPQCHANRMFRQFRLP